MIIKLTSKSYLASIFNNYIIKNIPPIIIVYLGPILDSRIYPIVLNINNVIEFIGPNMKVSLVVKSG